LVYNEGLETGNSSAISNTSTGFPISTVSDTITIIPEEKVDMSFGFSIGDIITVIELTNRIRKDFADAPRQFNDILNEFVPPPRQLHVLTICA
jgi:hypothetical protein